MRSPYDGRMENKQNTQTQIFPGRRTDATYRAVLQRYDPEAGRYRTLESARIETPPGAEPAAVRSAWSAALAGAFGAGAAAGLGPEPAAGATSAHEGSAPLGSGLNLADMDSDI
jgi:hypothetical protein